MLTVKSMYNGTVECVPLSCYPPSWAQYGCRPATGYDPHSTQPWTTSRKAFLVKEMALRLALGLGVMHIPGPPAAVQLDPRRLQMVSLGPPTTEIRSRL